MNIEIREPKLSWDWDTGPRYYSDANRHLSNVDPTPAYSHELDAVHHGIELATAVLKPIYSIHTFLLGHEVIGRTNGWSSYSVDREYDDEKKQWKEGGTIKGLITLSAKRIPPHPAMTRYLMVHEYGHHVEWMLSVLDGSEITHNIDHDKIRREYAKMRGMKDISYYGPGTWHASAGEVFANDFRIVVCNSEVEYWPHPGIPRPDSKAVQRAVVPFWETATKLFKEHHG